MCGIVGFINLLGDKDALLRDSMHRIVHRGPDASGVYADDEILLGHLRLSIIDLSRAANQPMHSQCGRYVIVYNGEVYNFKEIQKQIAVAKSGFEPRTGSDTEIILEAFCTWGKSFVDRLNGMFAIAIWDKEAKQLFLFRDRMGIKPLYYYHHAGVFAFASELKALSTHHAICKTLTVNHRAINQFLHLGYIPAPDSVFEQIKKFPAGSYGLFEYDRLSINPYWQLEKKLHGRGEVKPADEYVEELKRLVESSVEYRLISDVPFGTFLSGGIDSSLVTAVAQSLRSNPINTFSIGFWDKKYDESPYARKIAEHLGTQHHSMYVTEADAIEWVPRLTGIYDEPFADSSAIPTLLVSQMARQHVTMTLSGDGGDELFLGYGAYQWARRLANPLTGWLRWPASMLIPHGPMKYRRAARLFEKVPAEQLKSHIFSQEQYLFSRKEIEGLVMEPFRSRFELREDFLPPVSQLSSEEQQAFFDLAYYLPDDLLVKVDRASMQFALETRVPLLDYRIVEWAVNLPVSMKLKNGESKWLLKQLLFQYLPEEFFQRPKRGFAVPLKKWLKAELRDFAMDYLNDEAIRRAGVLEPTRVKKLLDAFYNRNQDYLYNRIWLLLILQRWLLENRF